MNLKDMKMKREDLVRKKIISEDSSLPAEFPVLENITIPSVVSADTDTGEVYSFSVTAEYYLIAYERMQFEQAAAAAASASESESASE